MQHIAEDYRVSREIWQYQLRRQSTSSYLSVGSCAANIVPAAELRRVVRRCRRHCHASGRRSGDQFCVYVADRLVLPTLSQEDITAIASGRHQMDAFVRKYIHENLCYRFVMLPDGAAAFAAEAAIKNGEWEPDARPRSQRDLAAFSDKHQCRSLCS
jgi:hypothetical protein